MAISITATPFADFIAAVGPAKITVVKDTKNRFGSPYDPAQDHWKMWRDELLDILRARRPISDLQAFVGSGINPKKVRTYKLAADGMKKFIGRKTVKLLPVSTVPWTSGGLTVNVTPELGLDIGGTPHVIKLWLRSGTKLTKNRADVLLHLLELTHGSGVGGGAVVGVLDVANNNLITPTRAIPGIDALLAGEAASFASIWSLV